MRWRNMWCIIPARCGDGEVAGLLGGVWVLGFGVMLTVTVVMLH